MPLCISDLDKSFLCAFDSSTLDMADFHHREHVRLAYIALVLTDINSAYRRIRGGLLRLLQRNGIDQAQYHDTLTLAWVQEVKHLMCLTENARSAEDFIQQNPRLLDKEAMFTHYSRRLLAAEHSRKAFVPPDLTPIPNHGGL